ATYVVALAGTAAGHDFVERAGVVVDIEPVPDIVALAIDRDRLAVQRLQDRQRDQLFREMVGSIIVRAVAHHGRQAIGLMPGAHEVVGGGFRGGIGRIRPVAALLAEFALRPERPEYLVGRDMMKAEPRGPL